MIGSAPSLTRRKLKRAATGVERHLMIDGHHAPPITHQAPPTRTHRPDRPDRLHPAWHCERRDEPLHKPRCACHAGPPKLHGPYLTWTRKIAGKTLTRRLTPDQAERYRPWFEANRRLRELIAELEALSLQAAEHAERWREK